MASLTYNSPSGTTTTTTTTTTTIGSTGTVTTSPNYIATSTGVAMNNVYWNGTGTSNITSNISGNWSYPDDSLQKQLMYTYLMHYEITGKFNKKHFPYSTRSYLEIVCQELPNDLNWLPDVVTSMDRDILYKHYPNDIDIWWDKVHHVDNKSKDEYLVEKIK